LLKNFREEIEIFPNFNFEGTLMLIALLETINRFSLLAK